MDLADRTATRSVSPIAPKVAIAAAFLVVLAVVAVYWDLPGHGFEDFDSGEYITQNNRVRQGLTWDNLRWAFSLKTESTYWHPLTWLSLMATFDYSGLDPAGYHATDLVLHACNTLLLLFAFWRMSGRAGPSLLLALLFAVHPLNVETVAWVVERKNTLCLLFQLLGIHVWISYARRPGWSAGGLIRYASTMLCLCLALMAKPVAITFPAVLLLLDFWPLGRFRLDRADMRHLSRCLLEKLPLAAVSVCFAVVVLVGLSGNQALVQEDAVPVGVRAANALATYGLYVWKVLWPANLAVFYPYPAHVPWWHAALGGLFVVGVSALAWRVRRTMPWVPLGWFWFAGTMLPTSGLMQNGLWPQMADRFTYLPHIGLYAMLAFGLAHLMRRLPRRTVFAAWLAVGCCLCVLALAARAQSAHWQNGITLFTRAVNVTEGNVMAWYNLGYLYKEKGQYDEALRALQRAEGVKSGIPEVAEQLMLVHKARGENDEALRQAVELARRAPGDFKAQADAGDMLAASGNPSLAVPLLRRALALKPFDGGVLGNLGVCMAMQERYEEAVFYFFLALRERPGHAGTMANARRASAAVMQRGPADGEVRPPLVSTMAFQGERTTTGRDGKAMHAFLFQSEGRQAALLTGPGGVLFGFQVVDADGPRAFEDPDGDGTYVPVNPEAGGAS